MNDKRPIGITIFALVLFVWGLVWLGTIYKRSRIIVPDFGVSQSVGGGQAEPEVTEDGKRIIRFRSPHVKDHHIIKFRLLAHVELLCAYLFIFCGYLLKRGFAISRKLVVPAIALEGLFRLGIAGYLYAYAIPLANLIQNGNNIILDYYYPDQSVFSALSNAFSGITMYYPKLSIYLFVYIAYIGFALYYFTRPQIRAAIVRQKKKGSQK